ncbi:MAG: hypothetical protein JNK87_28595 [Bryobacterales bacterium]|nr:hypothetical protein [Bryobacterales bacterium]
MNTVGDLWLHRHEDYLWWTESVEATPECLELDDPETGTRIFVYYKPCKQWSNRDKSGALLAWQSLHRKARPFLTTSSTFRRASPDNAAYVEALIQGDDLSPWHDRPDWTEMAANEFQQDPVADPNDRAKDCTIALLAATALSTTAQSGALSISVTKNKEFRFTDKSELENYIAELLRKQSGVCALTGLTLQFLDGEDPELCCSLDRIDSNGHYQPGNLQIVCRFANRWKGASDDTRFRELLNKVRRQD